MLKPSTHAMTPYSRDAAVLLGRLIRTARIERKLTVGQLAERAGLSRGLVQRVERGDRGCAIGAVFECAALVGVRLFDLDQSGVVDAIEANSRVLTLMPKSVRTARVEARDDF